MMKSLDSKEEPKDNPQKDLIETGSVVPLQGKVPIQCLTIIGQIEGHYQAEPNAKTTRYEHIIPQLVAFQQNPEMKGLLVILNTVGGDVEAGLALAELISGMNKPTVSLVLGGGHSIGVPLAVSTRCSFIAPSATMTIHPVRVNGLVLGVPQTLANFQRMQDRITQFVTKNSKIDPKTFEQLMLNNDELVMDLGTVLDGQQAVEVGLIDKVGSLSDALEELERQIVASHSESQ